MATKLSFRPFRSIFFLLSFFPGLLLALSAFSVPAFAQLQQPGAPLGAVCQAPSALTISSGAPAPFTVSVSTSGGSSALLPPSLTLPSLPAPSSPGDFLAPAGPPPPLLFLTLALAFLFRILRKWQFFNGLQDGMAWRGFLGTALFFSIGFASGCGSSAGVSPTPPPPIVTPPGTTTLSISMTAMSATQQPLQLPPLQLTLTVK